jgi:hypothetical protein
MTDLKKLLASLHRLPFEVQLAWVDVSRQCPFPYVNGVKLMQVLFESVEGLVRLMGGGVHDHRISQRISPVVRYVALSDVIGPMCILLAWGGTRPLSLWGAPGSPPAYVSLLPELPRVCRFGLKSIKEVGYNTLQIKIFRNVEFRRKKLNKSP